MYWKVNFKLYLRKCYKYEWRSKCFCVDSEDYLDTFGPDSKQAEWSMKFYIT